MVYLLGGYFMDFNTTRTLMKTCDIDDKGARDDHLEFPINDWLAKTERFYVLAGAIRHPDRGTHKDSEDGILLVTQRVWHDSLPDAAARKLIALSEGEGEADNLVKEWLLANGVTEKNMEWVCIWDTFGMTRSGVHPRRNEIRKPLFTAYIRFKPEDLPRWNAAGRPDPREMFTEEEFAERTIL